MNPLSKINPFMQQQAITATQAFGGQSSAGVNGKNQTSASSKNTFDGNTVGINPNIHVGDVQNFAFQAGKAGFGKTLCIG